MTDYKDFICEYPFDGEQWALTIKATSHDEAIARLKAMPWATVKGEIVATIPLKGATMLWLNWLFVVLCGSGFVAGCWVIFSDRQL